MTDFETNRFGVRTDERDDNNKQRPGDYSNGHSYIAHIIPMYVLVMETIYDGGVVPLHSRVLVPATSRA